MLERGDACVVGWAAVLGDVVESTNYILKKGYNGHNSRGRGAGNSAVQREAVVVRQFWEWWSVTFDLPLWHYNIANTAACTTASSLNTGGHPPTPVQSSALCGPVALLLFINPWTPPS